MPHATVPSPGLQALILCGPGESLSTFTSIPKDFPKALVPIANRPMVWYPLDWCYRMGISNITLITPPESRPALESALATNPTLTSLPSPKPELISPADLTQTTGTGILLRLPEVQKVIKSDFAILPCDLISEIDGTRFIQQWMTLNPLSAGPHGAKRKGGLGVFYPTQGIEGISHKKDETDFIATVALESPTVPQPQGNVRPEIERLVLAMPTDTLNDMVDDGNGSLRLRSQLSGKYGRIKLRTKHRDAHVYIFPQWVKEYANRNRKLESVSEDVLGWWAKAQWQDGLGEQLGLGEVLAPTTTSSEDMDGSQVEEEAVDAASLSSTKVSPLPVRSQHSAALASRVKSSAPAITAQHVHIPPLLAYVQPTPATDPQALIRRVDNSHALLAVSLYLAKQQAHQLSHEHKVHPSAILAHQSRVSQEDSLVAENVKIGTRSIIKESVIGANCDIGANVRLTRCLLMDGVTVGDGVHLVGCIVGRRARIDGMKPQQPAAEASDEGKKKSKKGGDDDEERTKLTECEVAPNFVVEAGTEAKGEKMMPFNTEDVDDLEDEMEEDGEGFEL